MPEKLCIYHANCADGFGAALAVYRSIHWGCTTKFHAAHYGSTPPDVTLQQARIAAAQAKQNAKNDINPNEVQREAKATKAAAQKNTLQIIAEEWIERNRNKRTHAFTRLIERSLAKDIYPSLGKRNIKTITPAEILEILKRVEERGAPCVAINLKQFLGGIFRYAIITQRADIDPTAALRAIIDRPPVQHARCLTHAEITEYLTRLGKFKGYRTTGIALELILLLWTRTIELRKATWEEFDLPNARWLIPAERMKMRRQHIVPLPQKRELWENLKTTNPAQAQTIKEAMQFFAQYNPTPLLPLNQVQQLVKNF